MRIHQVLVAAAQHDAITLEALTLQRARHHDAPEGLCLLREQGRLQVVVGKGNLGARLVEKLGQAAGAGDEHPDAGRHVRSQRLPALGRLGHVGRIGPHPRRAPGHIFLQHRKAPVETGSRASLPTGRRWNDSTP